MEAASADRNQSINSDVDNARGLPQTRLQVGGTYSIGNLEEAASRKRKEAGRTLCPPQTSPGQLSQGQFPNRYLAAGLGAGGGHLRIGLRDADVSADGVLPYLVDDEFFGNVRAGEVEEDGLVHGTVLLLEELVFNGYGRIELVVLLVDTLQFNSDIAYLLRLVSAHEGEFNVVPFAEAAELVDFVVVAGDERAHLTASHFQVFAGSIEIGLNADYLGIYGLDIIAGGLGSEFGMYRGIQRGHLLGGLVIELYRFRARLLELPLGNLELIRDDLQVSLQIGVGLFVLRQAILHGRHILLHGGLSSF